MTKARYPVNPRPTWSPAHLALLAEHYPLTGAQLLLGLTGRKQGAINDKASKLGIAYIGKAGRPPLPKEPAKRVRAAPPHDPTPKAKNTLRPLHVAVPVEASAPVKRSPATPILNARIEARRRRQAEQDKGDILSRIKKLPANSEGRRVFSIAARTNGVVAKVAFLEWEATQQPKQAA